MPTIYNVFHQFFFHDNYLRECLTLKTKPGQINAQVVPSKVFDIEGFIDIESTGNENVYLQKVA